jgi:hypothetical protein
LSSFHTFSVFFHAIGEDRVARLLNQIERERASGNGSEFPPSPPESVPAAATTTTMATQTAEVDNFAIVSTTLGVEISTQTEEEEPQTTTTETQTKRTESREFSAQTLKVKTMGISTQTGKVGTGEISKQTKEQETTSVAADNAAAVENEALACRKYVIKVEVERRGGEDDVDDTGFCLRPSSTDSEEAGSTTGEDGGHKKENSLSNALGKILNGFGNKSKERYDREVEALSDDNDLDEVVDREKEVALSDQLEVAGGGQEGEESDSSLSTIETICRVEFDDCVSSFAVDMASEAASVAVATLEAEDGVNAEDDEGHVAGDEVRFRADSFVKGLQQRAEINLFLWVGPMKMFTNSWKTQHMETKAQDTHFYSFFKPMFFLRS